MIARKRHAALAVVIGITLLSVTGRFCWAQRPSKLEVGEWRDVLRNVKRELKRSYYDPTFHGMDIDTRFELADAKMANAESLAQLVGIVAQVLLDLNDSHTYFVPPYNATRVDYGWHIQPVGADCYVGAVRPGSDAEAKGLQVGDKVLSIDGRPLDRRKVWLANYLYKTLRPQPSMTLLIEKADKRQQQIAIKANVREGSTIVTYHDLMEMERDADDEARLTRHRFYEPNDDTLIWKMPRFDLSEDALADKFGKLRNRKALILDLRGNGGGYVDSLERFAGYFFESNVKLADRRGRKEFEPIVVRSPQKMAFKGQLIVLVDGTSASAAEIFARAVQLEKRGVVIGDRSSGSVMQSRFHRLQVGVKREIAFGISATEADVIMADGKSLEHVGVVPDELLLPTAQDMTLNHDPVLAHAASLVGINLNPKKAGALFAVEWK